MRRSLPSSLCQDPLLVPQRTRGISAPVHVFTHRRPSPHPSTAAMASVRLPHLLLALLLASMVALLLPSAEAFFPQQLPSSSSSSLMKHQQHQTGTNWMTQRSRKGIVEERGRLLSLCASAVRCRWRLALALRGCCQFFHSLPFLPQPALILIPLICWDRRPWQS